jgi:hypothetical protein
MPADPPIERHLFVATRVALRDDPGVQRLTDALRTATVARVERRLRR